LDGDTSFAPANSPISAGFDYSGLDSPTSGDSLGNSPIGGGFDYGGLDNGNTNDNNNNNNNNNNNDNDNDNGGQFARGGISGHLRPPAAFFQKGKFTTQPAKMYADGGITSLPNPFNLGSYSDGGRLLKGPGDGVSDSIPATIGKGQPARLADGEFVIPARIVSEIGNGSTEAGARKLYAMMDRIQAGRKKSVGRGKVAVNSRADRYLPA